ncbi:hypothetical protein FIE12Z_637 [Fusarium flagelliforme]|uniref:Uncharacterized protein n=2 Tax=Fusarium flagelliforme TaxID=2675880 RepID=A0A395N522_9HYPO|nr:hypothetical protein FIE12Z_637 [Fusarium flagelliforme]
MPKTTTARCRCLRYEPYDQWPISRRRAKNKRIKKLKNQLEKSKAEVLYWKREYKLSCREVYSLKKHVKRLLDDFEDRGELQQEMTLLRLQMMNLGM